MFKIPVHIKCLAHECRAEYDVAVAPDATAGRPLAYELTQLGVCGICGRLGVSATVNLNDVAMAYASRTGA